jgi:hypothetical protein
MAKRKSTKSFSAINRQLYTFHKAIIAIRDFCYLTDVIQSHSGYTKEIKGINKDAFKLAVRFMKYSSDRGVIYPVKKEASL